MPWQLLNRHARPARRVTRPTPRSSTRRGRRPRPTRTLVPQVRPVKEPGRGPCVHRVPRTGQPKVWNTNKCERVINAIKRLSRVAGNLPNARAVIRLVRAVLIEKAPTNGSLATAAISQKSPWRCPTPAWILEITPRSTGESRVPMATSKPTTPQGSALTWRRAACITWS